RAVAAQFPSREAAAASLWRLGWLAYGKRDSHGAQKSWTRLAELGSTGAYRMPALYWTGRARELAGGGGAADLYNQILAEAPRSYYGMLAAARLGRTREGGIAGQIALPREPRTALSDDSGLARVVLLRRINLVEEAAAELENAVQGAAGDPVRLYGMAGGGIAGGGPPTGRWGVRPGLPTFWRAPAPAPPRALVGGADPAARGAPGAARPPAPA